jgi:YHS domain-containing protein
MKSLYFLIAFVITVTSYSQSTIYNTKNGYAANGYDVVAYFRNEAHVGNDKYIFTYDNVDFKFSNKENLNLFKSAPKKYIPQYGGWCAYALALKNKKVGINPKTFEIRGGKLYLFYNSKLINTHKKWLGENPKVLIRKADDNWRSLLNETGRK